MRAGVYGRQSRGKAKSIEEQLKLGLACVEDQGWELAGSYQDGSSASRFSRKPRGGWAQVRADVAAKAFDVLVLWESSRGDRTPETWFAFLRECRDAGVLIHVIKDEQTLNPGKPRDWKTLAEDGVSNAYESELISQRVKRGHSGAARSGRPSHGNAPFGYVRTYDPRTGELLGQSPDPEHAATVQLIISRVAAGVPVSAIVKDLNARQVPTGGAKSWYRVRVREIAINRAYIGLRVYNGQTYPGSWEPLVDADTFWAAQQVLSAPGRKVTRPGRQRHLVSYYATCTACDGPLCAAAGRYRCQLKSCLSAPQEPIDDLIRDLVLARLADPAVYAALRHAGQTADEEVSAAAAQVQALEQRLADWRRSAARGLTSPESLAAIEADITEELAVARAKADRVSVPAALAGWLGQPEADLAARWAAAGVPARRTVMRALGLRVRLLPHTRPGRPAPAHERIDVDWLGAVA